MADTEDTSKKENKPRCSGGPGCGSRCCGSKALMVLILVLLGGIIGYLMGSHGSYGRHGWHHKHGCQMSMGSPSSQGAEK
jgi:hypothetical protein